MSNYDEMVRWAVETIVINASIPLKAKKTLLSYVHNYRLTRTTNGVEMSTNKIDYVARFRQRLVLT